MEWVSGNLFIRPSGLLALGSVTAGHKHAFDHTTIVFTGAVLVRAVLPNGRQIEQEFRAPSHFLVLAHVEHEITALEDHTQFWCVYSHRTPQGDVSQTVTGWYHAYDHGEPFNG